MLLSARVLKSQRTIPVNTQTSLSGPWIAAPRWRQGSVRNAFTSQRKVPEKGTDGLKAKTSSAKNSSRWASPNWKRFALFVKVTRIPMLIAAVYGLGYQQGIMDTVRNPLKLQQGTFESLCKEMGVNSGEDIEMISERMARPRLVRLGWWETEETPTSNDARAQKVADIGREIIRAARTYVRQQLDEAVQKAKKKLESQSLDKVEYARLIHADKEVEFWLEAHERIEGNASDGIKNWQYILLNTQVPNAFVTEMLPQRFFVTTGLFDSFIENDDELAMVLGHEISHVILGHLSQRTLGEFAIRGLEIVVLMLDPTEGLFSLGIATFLASTRDAFLAAHSRSHETDADELGCKLAAMACYDTVRGCKVFKTMHECDEKNGTAERNLMSSHPASSERYEFLKTLSSDENMAKYSYCNNLEKRLHRALTIEHNPPPKRANLSF